MRKMLSKTTCSPPKQQASDFLTIESGIPVTVAIAPFLAFYSLAVRADFFRPERCRIHHIINTVQPN